MRFACLTSRVVLTLFAVSTCVLADKPVFPRQPSLANGTLTTAGGATITGYWSDSPSSVRNITTSGGYRNCTAGPAVEHPESSLDVPSLTTSAPPSPPDQHGITSTPTAPATAPVGLPDVSPPETSVIPYQSWGTAGAIVGGNTLSLGGSAVIDDGQTYSLISEPTGLAVVIDGKTTAPLVLSATAATTPWATQIVTLGTHVVTASPVPSGAGLVVDGVTVLAGTWTVVEGQTVSISGSELVTVLSVSTSTQSPGSFILIGLGGASTTASGSVATVAPSTAVDTSSGSRLIMNPFFLGAWAVVGLLVV